MENNAPRYSPDLSDFKRDYVYSKNESVNSITPLVTIAEIESIVCEMLEENSAYVKKFGLSEKAKQARQRLIKLFELSEPFNRMYSNNQSLQLINRDMFVYNQKLQNRINELETEIKRLTDINNF
jgi:hypothetical protein